MPFNVGYHKICYAVGASAALWLLNSWLRKRHQQQKLLFAIRERHDLVKEQLSKLKEIISYNKSDVVKAKRLEITSLPFVELQSSLQNGLLKPSDVLYAFVDAAIAANEKTNCICQFINEAFQWATELEAKYDGGIAKPPLYGIPISIKENISIKGYDSTLGYAQALNLYSDVDAIIIKHVKELGGIPFCRTNVPQTLLSFSCSNPIYGVTCNPYRHEKTCGGSSGGEAALIACNGSILGLGGDVGGSIRIPAHFCGIAGFKPSSQRISQIGSPGSVPGRPYVCSSLGPMAKDVETLAIFMQSLLGKDESHLPARDDISVVPLPFNSEVYNGHKRLTIGWCDELSFIPPSPACRRAVHEAKAALEAAGHKVIPFAFPDIEKAVSLFLSTCNIDGGAYIINRISKDIPDVNHGKFFFTMGIPVWIRRMLAPMFSSRLKLVLGSYAKNLCEMRAKYEEVEKYRRYFNAVWLQHGVDAVICPVNVVPAVPHAAPQDLFACASYTFAYNLLDYCAGVVKVTKVSTDDVANVESYPENDSLVRKIKSVLLDTFDLPVGVQCVAPPFREEICLRVLKEIEANI